MLQAKEVFCTWAGAEHNYAILIISSIVIYPINYIARLHAFKIIYGVSLAVNYSIIGHHLYTKSTYTNVLLPIIPALLNQCLVHTHCTHCVLGT